jgi:SNF2 family DNA or RNA helicase
VCQYWHTAANPAAWQLVAPAPSPRVTRAPSDSSQAVSASPTPSDLWTVDEQSLAAFTQALAAPAGPPAWFDLRRAAERIALVPGFERLITLDANTIKELPHQIDVALRVLRRPLSGRAILADEVGLGKTIEAGIILKELTVRGLARRVLIVTPAALVEQWRGELETKFFESFDVPEQPRDWRQATRAVVSYDRAISARHAKEILRHRWDLVIVDEAHKAKNERAARYRFLTQLERNYILLLTATPLQNNLRELYNLVTLLRPGQLGTWAEFRQLHVAKGDPRTPKDPEALKELTAQVMIRTRRSSVADALDLPPRRPSHPTVELMPAEAKLYGAVVSFLRALYREGVVERSAEEVEADRARRGKRRTGKGILQLELVRLCQRLCSSSRALADSLEVLSKGELVTSQYRAKARKLATAARRVARHGKLIALEEVLAEHRDRVIVFSEHLPTLDLIAERVKKLKRKPIIYSGALSQKERAKRLTAFKENERAVLIATRSGTEGLNLQFCNVLVNYELPWNPMVVEQRIGRIHRIGQTREAHIINLAAQGTVEAQVLRLLDQKIRLFELVVGELDIILGDFGGAESLEEQLAGAWLGADSDEVFERGVETIGEEIAKSREAGIEQERLNSEMAADDAAAQLERGFKRLSLAQRIRLGYGTRHVQLAAGVESTRHRLGLHVNEILEALESATRSEDAGVHAELGPLKRVSGVTASGRSVHLLVSADELPMTLADIEADAA